MIVGGFAVFYAIARSFCEFFREPDAQLGFLWGGATMGNCCRYRCSSPVSAFIGYAMKHPLRSRVMDAATPLEAEIRRRIQAAGPIPVAEYMALCLTDRDYGYYTTRDPLGERGDFITAPEISQMFGELIGLWMAAVWKQMGAPENLRIIELGPGRGTLLNDALRAVQVVPGFRDSVLLHLVEINPVLQAQQERTLEHAGSPDVVASGAGRRAGRALHHYRQRILRRAAGEPGGEDRARLA